MIKLTVKRAYHSFKLHHSLSWILNLSETNMVKVNLHYIIENVLHNNCPEVLHGVIFIPWKGTSHAWFTRKDNVWFNLVVPFLPVLQWPCCSRSVLYCFNFKEF